MYKTAKDVSSNAINTKHSIQMTDQLLLNNGHKCENLEKLKKSTKKKIKTSKQKPIATLKIPHLSDNCTAQIERAAKSCFLPIRVVSTPGNKLGKMLTSSKPRDPVNCPDKNCVTCKSLTKGKCTTPNVTYRITCAVENTITGKECSKHSCGETDRPVRNRFVEHYRNAKNPTCASYTNKTLAKHYRLAHPGVEPKLKLDIVDKANSTRNRLIKEAKLILRENPTLNCKNEQIQLAQLLV